MKKYILGLLLLSSSAQANCIPSYDIVISVLRTYKWCSTTATATGGVCAAWLWENPIAKGFFTCVSSGSAAYVGIAMTLEGKMRLMRSILMDVEAGVSSPALQELHSKLGNNIEYNDMVALIKDANKLKLFCPGSFTFTTVNSLLNKFNDGSLVEKVGEARRNAPSQVPAPQPEGRTLEIITEEPSFSL